VRALIFWDIYGRLGRKAFIKEFEALKEKYEADISIVNIENITSWRGPASIHAQMIDNLWVDLMTWGDHVFDNMPDIATYFWKENCKLIRPANFLSPEKYPLPWNGYKIITTNLWYRVLVIQLLWEVFMNQRVENPFHKVTEILDSVSKREYDICLVEFHKEATAEFYGMAHYLDGRVSLVYGTHTHIQTNDAQVLWGWTGIITDIWMNGPYDSVIGATFESVEKRFLSGISKGKIVQQLKWKYIINAIIADIDEVTGECKTVKNISFTWQL